MHTHTHTHCELLPNLTLATSDMNRPRALPLAPCRTDESHSGTVQGLTCHHISLPDVQSTRMLRLLTAPPPLLSCTRYLLHAVSRAPLCSLGSGTRFQPQSHPEPSSGVKNCTVKKETTELSTAFDPCLFVKVLHLPTNPCPPKLAHGAPALKVTSANLLLIPAPVEVVQWPG